MRDKRGGGDNIIIFPDKTRRGPTAIYSHFLGKSLSVSSLIARDIQRLVHRHRLLIMGMGEKRDISTKDVARDIMLAVTCFSSFVETDLFDQLRERDEDSGVVERPFSWREVVEQVYRIWSLITSHHGINVIFHYDQAIPEVIIGDSLILFGILLRVMGMMVQLAHNDSLRVVIKRVSCSGSRYVLRFTVENLRVAISSVEYRLLRDSVEGLKVIDIRLGSDLAHLRLGLVKRWVDFLGGEMSLVHRTGGQVSWSAVIPFEGLGRGSLKVFRSR